MNSRKKRVVILADAQTHMMPALAREMARRNHDLVLGNAQEGLADELRTSDELLGERAQDRDVYSVSFKIRQPLQKRVMANVESALERVEAAGWRRKFESRLPR